MRRILATAAALLLGVGIAWQLPVAAPPDAIRAAEAIPASGVTNPVTAVLLNFRAWDTLLEVGVLVLAVAGAWAVAPAAPARPLTADPLIDPLVRLVIPPLLLVASALLWLGTRETGGAFQAGATLAGGAVLLFLSGRMRILAGQGALLRWTLVLGLAVFLGAGLLVGGDGPILTWRGEAAYRWILAIELAATLSIAAVLASLFARRVG